PVDERPARPAGCGAHPHRDQPLAAGPARAQREAGMSPRVSTLLRVPHFNPAALWIFGVIFAVLVVATTVVWLLGRLTRGRACTARPLLSRTWGVLGGALPLAPTPPRPVSRLLFAFVSFLALRESLSPVPPRRADRVVLFWAYLAIPLQYLWIGMHW